MAEATETALACIREEVERAFSSAPGAVLEAALSRIAPADECARAAAYAAWDSIAHPLGGLGDFEDAVACIAAAQGSAEVAEFPRALAVFFSDNGVVAEGVSQSGQDVTRAVARNMCEGATSACRMAAFAGAEVVPIDVGMARGIEDARMVRANVRRGAATSRTAPLCLAMGPCVRSRSESPSRAGLPAPACAFSPRARWASATRPPRRR